MANEKKIKSFFKSLGLILLYIVISTIISAFHLALDIDGKMLNNVLLSLESLIIAIIIGFILKKQLKGQFKDFKKNYRQNLKTSFKHWWKGFLAMYITNLIIYYFILGGIAPNEEANRELLTMYPLYSVISMCLIGPFTEELLFRLSFKDSITNRKLYIAITGIIFGLMHVVLSFTNIKDLFYIIPYSCLGFAFAAAYYDTKNIYSSTIVHMFHNSLSIALIMLSL